MMNTAGQRTILSVIFFRRLGPRFLILFLSLAASIAGLALPYYQKMFSDNLNENLLYLCVGLSLLYLAFNQLTLFLGQNEALQAQKYLAQLIYEHNLKLKPLSLQKKSVGEVVSLYTTDIPSLTVWLEQSLPYGLTTLFPLVLTPIFLHQFYGLNPWFSYGLVAALIVLNGLMAYRQSLFFFKFKTLAADRMGLVNEWIQNIRGLKILNWIEGFESKIIKKRKEETVNRVSMVTNGQVMNSISSSINFWLNLVVLFFLLYISKVEITKPDLIALLWVTSVFLSRPLRQLPWFFTFVFDAWTSFKRLADFLNIQNQNYEAKQTEPSDPTLLLDIQNMNLSVQGNQLLDKIHLQIKPKTIVALIGPVGSGKTMLMKSIIGETPFTADRYYKTKTSYVPQDQFIMSASLRDNVAFAYQSPAAEDQNILNILKKSQFDFTVDRVEKGLDTQIGERGLNLSGGQKQRVSLARQLHLTTDLYLFDDPLSAVDVTTERHLIREFTDIKNKGASLILTTQRFTVLPHCDRVIFLNDGRIEYDGSAQDFLNQKQYESFLTGLSS